MKFYRAIDPLPGASNNGASVWARLGDKLVELGFCHSVIFVPIALGGTFIRDWATGGGYYCLMFAVHRLRLAQLKIDMLCWHQGEADANLTNMTAREYRALFLSIVRALRYERVSAPIYVVVATLVQWTRSD